MKARFLISVLALPMLACGPAIQPQIDDTGSSSGATVSTAATATTAATTSSTIPPDPSTTTSSTTGVDSTDSTAALFIVIPDYVCLEDDESWHCSFECSSYFQDCPRGEKCMPWSNDGSNQWTAHRCSPIDEEPVGWGETCTVEEWPTSGRDNCELPAMCWSVDPNTLQGTCVPQCAGDEEAPECPTDTSCFVAFDGVLALCLPPCDPLAGDCGPEEICAPDQTGLVFGCARAVTSEAAGAPCERLDACAPDLVCVDPMIAAPSCDLASAGCCTPWCDLSAPDPSSACFDPAQQCLPWFEMPPPGYQNLGVCAVPA